MVVILEWYVSATNSQYRRTIEGVIDLETQSNGPDGSIELETKEIKSIVLDLGDDWGITVFTDNGVKIEPTTNQTGE